MRIGILCYDVSRNGGSEKVAVQLSLAMQTKYDVNILSLFSEHTNKKIPELEKLEYMCMTARKGSFIRDFHKTFNRLKKCVKENKIEVILSIGVNASLYACLLKRFTSVKVVVCEHSNLLNSMYNSFRQNIKRNVAVRRSDRLITLTEADCLAYKEKYPKYKSKVYYIYNWIEDKWLEKSSDQCYDKNSKRILTICRLDRVKGIERSIQVAKNVLNQYPEWEWHIYGDGDVEYLRELQALTKEMKLEKQILFMGRCNDPMSIYQRYAMYACTSYFEGMPMSFLEAKSKSLPIISFDIKTGPKEIIRNSENGFLVKDGDIDGFSEALKKLIGDELLRVSFAENAHLDIYKFQKANIIQKWIKLIDEVTTDADS